MSRFRPHVRLVKINERGGSGSTRLVLPRGLYCFESLAMFPFASTVWHKSEVSQAHFGSLCFCGRFSLRLLFKIERLIRDESMDVGGASWSPCDVQSRSFSGCLVTRG